jgi:ribokinase
MADLAVIGSLNMDLVIRAERIPAPGETILGSHFEMLPGGKGANQAYAAARLGGRVRMAGKVGYDLFGDRLRANLAAVGADVSQVRAVQNAATGVATITVDATGQNSIVVASGANWQWREGEPESLRAWMRGARVILFQLETPLEIVQACLRIAREEGAVTILDPAPARPLPREVYAEADWITPNESEALLLLGEAPRPVSPDEAPALAQRLHALGARQVLLKLGDKGSFASAPPHQEFAAAFPVAALDTTAAGDTFNAAFAVAWAEGRALPEALVFANKAAAISVTRPGAQTSAPTRAEVDAFLQRKE